jgi:hypothetical protein
MVKINSYKSNERVNSAHFNLKMDYKHFLKSCLRIYLMQEEGLIWRRGQEIGPPPHRTCVKDVEFSRQLAKRECSAHC